jgi:hypothetical protein
MLQQAAAAMRIENAAVIFDRADDIMARLDFRKGDNQPGLSSSA